MLRPPFSRLGSREVRPKFGVESVNHRYTGTCTRIGGVLKQKSRHVPPIMIIDGVSCQYSSHTQLFVRHEPCYGLLIFSIYSLTN